MIEAREEATTSPHDHGHGDGHDHHHGHSPARRIAVALVLTAGTMVFSVVGGILAQSLALLSDAGHMLADAGALALALVAQRVAERPRTQRRTYGFRRAETLAAFLNAILLGVASLWVVREALDRWAEPPVVQGRLVVGFAVAGLVVNLVAARVLAGGHTHNENTQAALAHVLSDAAGSVAAIIAGLLVAGFGWNRADPLISILLSVLMAWSAWKLVIATVRVLMESAPLGLATADLEQTIRRTPGVAELHDLHAWTISRGFDVVTVHVVLDGSRHGTEVARDVSDRVRTTHGIDHVTVQPEAPTARVAFVHRSELRR